MRVWGLFAAGIALAACRVGPACDAARSGARAANGSGESREGGSESRCGADACPHDAVRIAGRCTCAAGLAVIDGACVTADEARAYCGPAARWDGGKCVARACARGEALDTTDGSCAVTKTLREMALRDRLAVDADQTLACHDDHVLVVSAGHLSCLPEGAMKPRGSAISCGPGEVAGSACVPLAVHGAAGDAYTIDVSLWASLVLGPDGGEATAEVCAPLAASPRAFGVGPAVETRAALEIGLIFPNNDITQVRASVIARDAGSAAGGGGGGGGFGSQLRPFPDAGADLATRAVAALVAPLRAWGGTASAASLSVHVHCTIAGGAPPMAVSRD